VLITEIDIKKACCFTGHRPEKCKGTEAEIRKRLNEEIRSAISAGFSVFITGMATGVDTWAAEEVLNIKAENHDIKLICAVPFEGMEKNRPPELQNRYKEILNKADSITYICPKYTAWCFHKRNEWMVDHAAKVIAVFNGTPGGTEYTINYAKRNARDIVLIIDEEGGLPHVNADTH